MTTPTASKTEATVLIVDDEPNMRTTLADILRNEGYETATAETGEQAIEMCRQRTYDIVLMDVRMPGIDGVEAFREIRREQAGARIILMTAYSLDELKRAALDEGAIAFLPKPLDVENVLNLISEVKNTAILVVEDEESTATTLRDTLRKQGYHVTVTGSPHAALGLVEQIRFDIVFIDAKLPAMNGLELYLAIKKLTPTATAIMLTGNEKEFEEIAKEAVRRTAYTVLKKPLDIDEVLSMLERISGQRASSEIRKPAEGAP
jgi:DNA-binding NtrC family response regulator